MIVDIGLTHLLHYFTGFSSPLHAGARSTRMSPFSMHSRFLSGTMILVTKFRHVGQVSKVRHCPAGNIPSIQ
jgi:hypothetical protein